MNDLINNISCDVIQDIIPLYHDKVCSDKSCEYVEEHIKTCENCNRFLKSLDEITFDSKIDDEKQKVLAHHAKKEKTAAMKTGMFIAAILLLPIVIAFILTIPGYSDWKVNAVLIASMLLTAGLTVVPLMSKTKKLSKTIIFSTLALLLVIFFVEMLYYAGGILEFCEIAFSVVFGISVLFFPVVIRQAELPEILKNKKALLTMLWDTLWFYLMIFTFAIAFPDAFKNLLFVGTFGIILTWAIFVVARYIKFNCVFKAGIIIAIIDAWLYIGTNIGWITVTTYASPNVVFIPLLIVSLILIGVGIMFAYYLKNKGGKSKIKN